MEGGGGVVSHEPGVGGVDGTKTTTTTTTAADAAASAASAAMTTTTTDATRNVISDDPRYDDETRHMTYGRRLARFLSYYRWYYPNAGLDVESSAVWGGGGDDEVEGGVGAHSRRRRASPPSLDAAWAFFEHVTLPRHHLSGHHAHDDDLCAADRKGGVNALMRALKGVFASPKSHGTHGGDYQERSPPGENDFPTRLYGVWSTPESQLADFGVGTGLYFNSLRWMAIISLCAGLLNVPVMLYYRSEEYSRGQGNVLSDIVLKGSAVCTDQKWSACPTCAREDWDAFPATYDRYAEMEADGETLRFIYVNRCDADATSGAFVWASLIFVAVSIYLYGFWSERMEVEFDVAQQTTTDYSVEVENPPGDACDAMEWREFFSRYGHVTACTVVIDNEELIHALVRREALLLRIESQLPAGEVLDRDNLEEQVADIGPLPCWRRFMCASHATVCLEKIREIDVRIERLSHEKFDASNVFVTYETEAEQRRALEVLSVRKWDVWTNNVAALPHELRFRGERVLSVREPPEPDSVRWQDLDETFFTQVIMRTITTTISLAAICGGGVLIALARTRGAADAAIVITCLNTVTPPVVKFITRLESHSSEGSMQASQYIKMTFFRWANTAIVTSIISPISDTLQSGEGYLMNSLYAIFITEMLKTPVLQIGDVMGNIGRHVLAPRAVDQRRMNLNFGGTPWELSERYTDMTKVLFLCFFYSVVFPAGFFLTAFTLAVHYWTDKFCLLRTWAPAPQTGTDLAKFSRDYFFTLAIVAYAVMASYSYASFPFDNACEDTSSTVDGKYVMTDQTAITTGPAGEDVPVNVTVTADESNYYFCSQDMIRYSPPAFPPLPEFQPPGYEWMTTGQERWAEVLGWTGVGVLAVGCAVFLNRTVIKMLRVVFRGTYRPSGRAMESRFSEVKTIYGYVPQIKVPGHSFPKLLCDVDGIDKDLIGWEDSHSSSSSSSSEGRHKYDGHNFIFDVPRVAAAVRARRRSGDLDAREEDDGHPVFSVVRHWPPPESDEAEGSEVL